MDALEDARARAARIKLMAFDVDGVLSDGSLYYTDEGVEIKAFNSVDGLGINLLQKAGIELAIITGRNAPCVEKRAKHLHIGHLYQGVEDKLAALRDILRKSGLLAEEAGYMGDDIIDLRVMAACGFSAAPADSRDLIKRRARWVSRYPGGRGAVREVCEFILEAQGRLNSILAAYLPEPSE
ncbi:MAG: HAD family hydrolase [Candidatus Accumulibacter sp.]|jgi:3-deoxy-D-manno-octulosonate 8-phosphate phosphatase (KDO 8-P phosphatase)|nr:HAD family hydrolase [Accumulibacter sp.]